VAAAKTLANPTAGIAARYVDQASAQGPSTSVR
jgi:hypothetical protein